MLTLQSLAARLTTWSSKINSTVPMLDTASGAACPIIVYQSVFALFHDLKASAHLSTDADIRSLIPLIERCDEWLRKLAHDELELATAENIRLQRLAVTLKDLGDVEKFWKSVCTDAEEPHREDPAVILPGFSWEAHSRARATSARRHGYVFFEKADQVELSKLPEHEGALYQEISRLNGLFVTRLLNPRPQGTLLVIEARQVIALPKKVVAPSGWIKV